MAKTKLYYYLKDELGVTQEELGKRLKTTKQNISRIINHPESISVKTLNNIAKALEVSPDDLFKKINEKFDIDNQYFT